MELLLIQRMDSYMCLDMKDVTRVVALSRDRIDPDRFLAAPDRAPLGIMLKNGRVLPVTRVVKTITFQGKTHPLNAFLKGCLTRTIMEGFVITEERIYGLLSRSFLQLNKDSNDCRDSIDNIESNESNDKE